MDLIEKLKKFVEYALSVYQFISYGYLRKKINPLIFVLFYKL
jgi:hypothetical protein